MGSTRTSILEILRNANSSVRVLRSTQATLPWAGEMDATGADMGQLVLKARRLPACPAERWRFRCARRRQAAPVGQPWLWTLAYGHHEDRTHEPTREAAMAIASTPCSPLSAKTSALGYNEDRPQLQLWMVGREARHGGPTCVQNISWARLGAVAGGVAAWVARMPGFLFPKFFPKKFGQKIGAGPPMEDFGNGTCAGPVLLHPAPLSCRWKIPVGVLCWRRLADKPNASVTAIRWPLRRAPQSPVGVLCWRRFWAALCSVALVEEVSEWLSQRRRSASKSVRLLPTGCPNPRLATAKPLQLLILGTGLAAERGHSSRFCVARWQHYPIFWICVCNTPALWPITLIIPSFLCGI